jgi:hypothetical protein
MKRLAMALAALLLGLGMTTGVPAEAPPEPDWLGILTLAAQAGDREVGLAACEGWNAVEGRARLDYDELMLLAGFLTRETDSPWLTDELRFGLGEVALNRVASPEYPDSLGEVLSQLSLCSDPGDTVSREIPAPSRRCLELALRLLLGERRLEPRVISLSPRPSGPVHSVFRDLHYGSLYFCESTHPELYEAAGETDEKEP